MPNNVKATARKYAVDAKSIRRWKAVVHEIAPHARREQLTRNDIVKYYKKKTLHKGAPGKMTREQKAHLLEFYETRRRTGMPVTVSLMTMELLRLDPTLDVIAFDLLRFRVHRFLISQLIVFRHTTHKAQNHSYNQAVIDDYVSYTRREIAINNYRPDVVVNMDETNVDFDMVSATTLDEKGARSVSVKSTGSTQRCTVILAVTARGVKLPPLCIFKGVDNDRSRIKAEFTNPRLEYPQDLVYAVQEKAWNDASTMRKWIELVWRRFCEERGLPNYLILDEFSVHMMSQTMHEIQSCGTQVGYIPAGYTGAVQVLDKGVNKLFKDKLRFEYLQWMVANPDRKPKCHDVAKWISRAWGLVTVPSITNTWNSIYGEW